MKQMTCNAMGGPADCTVMISGNSAVEMVDNGMKHMQSAHPDMAANVGKMSAEETTKWMADFQKKFDSAPEM